MSLAALPIQRHVPIPTTTKGRRKYPWRDMLVGDSFLVRIEPGQSTEPYWDSLTSCRANAQRVTGWKFTLRRTEYGIRAWRIA